jgi:DNA-directed RNA polymerase subunit RPC12/RpoP
MRLPKRHLTRCDRCGRRVSEKEEETQDGGYYVFPRVEDLLGYVCAACKPSMETWRPFTDEELAEADVLVMAHEHGQDIRSITANEYSDKAVVEKVVKAANSLRRFREMERRVKQRRAAQAGE